MTAQVREAAEKAIGQRGIVGDVYLFTAKKSKGHGRRTMCSSSGIGHSGLRA